MEHNVVTILFIIYTYMSATYKGIMTFCKMKNICVSTRRLLYYHVHYNMWLGLWKLTTSVQITVSYVSIDIFPECSLEIYQYGISGFMVAIFTGP